MTLNGCTAPAMDVVDAHLPLGDECLVAVKQRPDDCYEHPPCMWSDADLRITQNDQGRFLLEAASGGWDQRAHASERTAYASAASPEALARQLPVLLARLHASPPKVSQACVYMDPDPDMRVSDVTAFHGALTAQHVRAIGIFAALADDPLRFVQVTLAKASDSTVFVQEMRRYAADNGFEFSQYAWDGENRFQILGDGLAVTAQRFGGPTESAFRVMLEMAPKSDGSSPTEPMMDQLVNSFVRVAGSIEGAHIRVEQSRRRRHDFEMPPTRE